jgi:hypothetical protein
VYASFVHAPATEVVMHVCIGPPFTHAVAIAVHVSSVVSVVSSAPPHAVNKNRRDAIALSESVFRMIITAPLYTVRQVL